MNYIKLFNEFKKSFNESTLPKPQELIDTCEKAFPELKDIGRGFPIRMTRTEIVIRWKGINSVAILKLEDLEDVLVITKFVIDERDVLSGKQEPLELIKNIKL